MRLQLVGVLPGVVVAFTFTVTRRACCTPLPVTLGARRPGAVGARARGGREERVDRGLEARAAVAALLGGRVHGASPARRCRRRGSGPRLKRQTSTGKRQHAVHLAVEVAAGVAVEAALLLLGLARRPAPGRARSGARRRTRRSSRWPPCRRRGSSSRRCSRRACPRRRARRAGRRPRGRSGRAAKIALLLRAGHRAGRRCGPPRGARARIPPLRCYEEVPQEDEHLVLGREAALQRAGVAEAVEGPGRAVAEAVGVRLAPRRAGRASPGPG